MATPPYPMSIAVWIGGDSHLRESGRDAKPLERHRHGAVTASIAMPTPASHRGHPRRRECPVARPVPPMQPPANRSRRGTRIASQTAATSTMSAIPSPMRSYGEGRVREGERRFGALRRH